MPNTYHTYLQLNTHLHLNSFFTLQSYSPRPISTSSEFDQRELSYRSAHWISVGVRTTARAISKCLTSHKCISNANVYWPTNIIAFAKYVYRCCFQCLNRCSRIIPGASLHHPVAFHLPGSTAMSPFAARGPTAGLNRCPPEVNMSSLASRGRIRMIDGWDGMKSWDSSVWWDVQQEMLEMIQLTSLICLFADYPFTFCSVYLLMLLCACRTGKWCK